MKALLVLAAALVALYALLCAAMYLHQRNFIYFPQYTRIAASQTDFAFENEGHVLRGWVANPGQRDAVLYFGGNAESLQPMRDTLARWLPQHTSYLVAYRGYGANEGVPDEQALARDAVALFDHVRRRHRAGSIAVIGRSLGTGVASHVASRRPVSRLVLVTPFDSLTNVAGGHYPWLPVRWLMRERFDSRTLLSTYRAPVLIIRAGRDRIVPPARTDALINALPRPPEVLDIPDADHIDVVDSPKVQPVLEHFMDRP